MKDYNIGLDIGTTSVGWAVTESGTAKLVKKGNGNKRKSLWGVRLFDEGVSAEDRRIQRSSRRRYERRRQRINLLQKEFENEIKKVDEHFFVKLKEFKYREDDYKNKKYPLTKEDKLIFNEISDHKTIYHLRSELIINSQQKDIRLVYLALHHIIKYRGNFNESSANFSVDTINLKERINEFFDIVNEKYSLCENENFEINIQDMESHLIKDLKIDLKEYIKEVLKDQFESGFINEFFKAIVGDQFKIGNLLKLDDLEKEYELKFSASNFEEKYEEIETNLSEHIEAIEKLKDIYDTIYLKKLFKNNSNAYLSQMMVNKFEQHKSDLELLKTIFYNKKKMYHELFKTKPNKQCIYDQYVKNKIDLDTFCKEIIKRLEVVLSENNLSHELVDSYNRKLKQRLQNGEIVPRITETSNGKFPYQLNKKELIKIIENQGKYYPFLLDTCEDGTYKIEKLLSFKIPYYVGPLNKASRFSWLVRNSNEKITPYNFDRIVNKGETAECFIKRMISHCTYLMGEEYYALPSCSLLYEEFKVLNELKQIKVNGKKLEIYQQQDIIENYFKNNKFAKTDSGFKKYLKTKTDWNIDDIEVTGYSADKKFANSMQSYIDFFGKDGLFENTNYDEEDAEKIIEWITIFEDKDILKVKLEREYADLGEQKISILLKKKYTGWGNLSRHLLKNIYYYDKKVNINKSIITLLRKTENNFMQIINDDKYDFQKKIDEINKDKISNVFSYDLVKDLATSPATRKGIYQALLVVKEIIDYMGYEPVQIDIEMAREDGKKGRKEDRKTYLKKIYEDLQGQVDNFSSLFKELKSTEEITDKLYLYFLQCGRCLYCNKQIYVERLNTNDYEIDHIIPRTLFKDDSLTNNKALVCHDCNQEKAANFVLPNYIRTKNVTWWEFLNKKNLISNTKLYRLKRKEYSDEDIKGFINRQIVETRQITKHVANILESLYPKTKVVYLKSNISHDYREKFKLFKFRDINDFHHAQDAYLAAVLGDYKEKYLKWDINFEAIQEMNEELKNLNRKEELRYNFVVNTLDDVANKYIIDISKKFINEETGELIFDVKHFNETIEKTMYQNDVLISKKTEIKTGQLFKETIYPRGKGIIAIKGNMPVEFYGGYTSTAVSMLYLIEYNNKRKLIGIPISIANDEESIKDYLYSQVNTQNISILKKNIPFNSLIKFENQLINLKGYSTVKKNCEISNAVQLKINKQDMKKWKNGFNYILNNKKEFADDASKIYDEVITYLLSLDKLFPLFKNVIDSINSKLDLNILVEEEKKKIIQQLFIMYHCNSSNANLSFIKLGDRLGRLPRSNITKGKLIFSSVTGLKERIYEF